LATSVEGVVPEALETLSQPGDVAIVNGSAPLPDRLMDWLAGFAAPLCARKVKAAGLAVRVGLLETTMVTGIARGTVEPVLLMLTVALYVPAVSEVALTLTVMVAGVVVPELVAVSQAPPDTDDEIVTG
jgi:hypothetical protein